MSLVVCAAVSAILSRYLSEYMPTDQTVYLVGAVTITDPEKLAEYQTIAGPLAARTGGYTPLAFADPVMIEGQEPSSDLYFIERYDSAQDLQNFVQSKQFQQAKVLRDQAANVRFMMWMPAIDPDTLAH